MTVVRKMDLMEQPLVSVVTPVFNGERYLRECIESVLAQTYTNWDYTIVNNCSTDRTLEIAREYAVKDPRIRVQNNENFARIINNHNIACQQISPASKYCKVVFADDWLFPECLEKMVRLAEEHPSVVIVQSYVLSEKKVVVDGLPYPSTIVPGREACRMRLLQRWPSIFGGASTLMYRSDIVRSRQSFYNESNLHADSEVCYEFLEHHDYGFVHQVLSFHRVWGDSMSSQSQTLQTNLFGRLYHLLTYGPKYLSKEELEGAIRENLQVYYRSLGRQVWRQFLGGGNRDFWSLHRGKLASLGYPLSHARLAANAFSCLLENVFDPKRTVEKIARRLRC